MTYTLHHGDCLDVMRTMPSASVDAIICDPPYGVTSCRWDSVIPFAPMWEQLKRIIKPRGAIVLFGSQPFTSALVMSNPAMFKYVLVWDKVLNGAPLNAKIMPLVSHEDIVIFGHGKITYNPQMTPREKERVTKGSSKVYGNDGLSPYGVRSILDGRYTERYPRSILPLSNADRTGKVHPTQKPVALLSYLVKTYTNEGDTVLDFTFGSGTCGVACIETGRSFIGIERDTGYFGIAQARLDAAAAALHQQELAV